MVVADYRTDLLSGRSSRGPEMPVLGFLRSGIMRLVRPKKDATEAEHKAYEKRVTIYNKMVEEGKPWDEIGAAIGGKNFLTPENQDYFTVRESDCRTNPENAELLHKLYADADGKIRRVPIVFLSNDWIEIIPHQLAYWTQTKWVYKSEYVRARDPETGDLGWKRMCVKPIPYEKGKRPFGGRETDPWRDCRPEACDEYQKDLCKLSGYVEGVIPGTKGAGVWRIYSKSIYSFRQMMEKMELVQRATGRIIGLIDQKTRKPIFSVMKIADQEVSRYDHKAGESKKVDQDLIYLEADIDMFELMLTYQPQAVLDRGKQATAMITGGTKTVDPEPERKAYTLRHDPEPTNGAASAAGPIEAGEAGEGDDFHPQTEPGAGAKDADALIKNCTDLLNKLAEKDGRASIEWRRAKGKTFQVMTIEELQVCETELEIALTQV